MPDERPTADIYVLAGPNGAGKSSLIGAGLSRRGLEFFNPDAAAATIRAAHPRLTQLDANRSAWLQGQRLLQAAVASNGRFAFETTLGGTTVSRRLDSCLDAGGEVRMWFVGLESPELCLQRVRARVEAGGHDIPEADVRRRYDSGRQNLVPLLAKLTELHLYDNSTHGNPERGETPAPRLVLRTVAGALVPPCRLDDVPGWAKPIAMQAITVSGLADPPSR